ncbi:50S ribosomal protein L3 glutamine methyltransferase [Sterolibacterium denitrificans]|uniref:Ribosomal protein uL3 glutamine methyltransferase n=1 Tax=Sterolibacterium denitrificans TaxID=157592 RepID=A0A7Z7MVH4_9PROT|nr:50S ribosomal protein L3 N(5)-glutamine methyltransferase [Sterolibacterium denitrificans]SMB27532.1 50S ribosomal protein L3 glutamine methyltransferase [Sterolibacterium denitrificans]
MTTRPTDELITLRDWLRYAVSQFNAAGLHFGHGCDNAYDEAVWLILHTLHLPHDRLEPFLDARLTAAERLAVHHVLQQRIARRLPAAYLTNQAWLGEFSFYVDERVIVPRSYFANLLEEEFAPWIESPAQVRSALDLCTGSGCLAILMALTFPDAEVDAVDLSTDALAVAQRNIADYGLAAQVRPIHSDLFGALAGRRYDLIVSNPPYVTQAAMDALPQEYRHEPALALAAGADGLDIVRRILVEAATHLQPGGLLAVEVGHNRDLVETAFPELPLTWIDTAGGEEKIFIIQREQLPAAQAAAT